MRKISVLLLLSMLPLLCFSKDLGAIGNTFKITETDLIKFIKNKIYVWQSNGNWEVVKAHWRDRASQYRLRPTQVSGVTHAIDNLTYYYDPSTILTKSIYALDGKLIAPAGEKINPLATIHLSKVLIFIDADHKKEIKWAQKIIKSCMQPVKVILTNGALIDAEKTLNHQVYFDQNGNLTTHFHIKHVPAFIEQDGLRLKITEYKL